MCLSNISILFDVHNINDNEQFIPDILSTIHNLTVFNLFTCLPCKNLPYSNPLGYEQSIISYYAVRFYCVQQKRRKGQYKITVPCAFLTWERIVKVKIYHCPIISILHQVTMCNLYSYTSNVLSNVLLHIILAKQFHARQI